MTEMIHIIIGSDEDSAAVCLVVLNYFACNPKCPGELRGLRNFKILISIESIPLD